MTSALFELENVSFAVPWRTLLQPLTMSIQAASLTALIGHNGSGKSTLLKILARQHPASGGTVRFAGKPLNEWGDREFARKLAYLPQQTAAASGMLVKELVALGRYPWHGALGRFGLLTARRLKKPSSSQASLLSPTVWSIRFQGRTAARMACHAGCTRCRMPAARRADISFGYRASD